METLVLYENLELGLVTRLNVQPKKLGPCRRSVLLVNKSSRIRRAVARKTPRYGDILLPHQGNRCNFLKRQDQRPRKFL